MSVTRELQLHGRAHFSYVARPLLLDYMLLRLLLALMLLVMFLMLLLLLLLLIYPQVLRHVVVRKQVGLEVAALIEAARADRTLVRRLLHVQNLVHREGPTLTETLAALVTLERLVFTVNVAVKGKTCGR